jgi:hypothetical protein
MSITITTGYRSVERGSYGAAAAMVDGDGGELRALRQHFFALRSPNSTILDHISSRHFHQLPKILFIRPSLKREVES